ncbi:hypothetical protein A0H81_03121 [Grifola frondosa]|uniref:Uncharacterized protein n=1 Tax=Grifola frondosa TaxID=5627 RepID=A0A1C7MJ20_GRIFR|nr:hypothetical protein A0H81_03121 [Grifola frondosa]
MPLRLRNRHALSTPFMQRSTYRSPSRSVSHVVAFLPPVFPRTSSAMGAERDDPLELGRRRDAFNTRCR